MGGMGETLQSMGLDGVVRDTRRRRTWGGEGSEFRRGPGRSWGLPLLTGEEGRQVKVV